MTINNKLITTIEDSGLDVSEALLFCFAVEHQEYDMLDKLLEKNIITPDNEHYYRINLCTKDENTLDLKLKIPLYGSTGHRSMYSEFLDRLLGHQNMTEKGHIDNQKDYIVINASKAAEIAFNELTSQIEDFDMDRLVEATIKFYRDVRFAPILYNDKGTGYLQAHALLAYKNYKQEKPNLI